MAGGCSVDALHLSGHAGEPGTAMRIRRIASSALLVSSSCGGKFYYKDSVGHPTHPRPNPHVWESVCMWG